MVEFRSLGMRIALATATALFWASPTLAQTCSYNYTRSDQSSPGAMRLQAATTQDNCTGRKAEVRGWISGGGFTCQTGSVLGSTCSKEETDGETNAIVTVAKSECNTGEGNSHHYMWDPQVTIAQEVETPLDASCDDSCEAMNHSTCIANEPQSQWGNNQCVTAPGSPIIIATKKQTEYKLTTAVDGVFFDIDGDGVREQVAWTERDSGIAFLALDRDGDGQITSGKELFGGHTLPRASNGFVALQMTAMATNGGVKRGSVSRDDPVFDQLLLWTDKNHNGFSEKGELRPVGKLLSAIGVSYAVVKQPDERGNYFLWKGWAHLRTAPGRNKAKTAEEDKDRSIAIWDVFFDIVR